MAAVASPPQGCDARFCRGVQGHDFNHRGWRYRVGAKQLHRVRHARRLRWQLLRPYGVGAAGGGAQAGNLRFWTGAKSCITARAHAKQSRLIGFQARVITKQSRLIGFQARAHAKQSRLIGFHRAGR